MRQQARILQLGAGNPAAADLIDPRIRFNHIPKQYSFLALDLATAAHNEEVTGLRRGANLE